MVKRKIYARPLIAEFLLDSELSLVMSSDNTPDNPGGTGDPEPVDESEEGLNQSNKSRSFENNPFE